MRQRPPRHRWLSSRLTRSGRRFNCCQQIDLLPQRLQQASHQHGSLPRVVPQSVLAAGMRPTARAVQRRIPHRGWEVSIGTTAAMLARQVQSDAGGNRSGLLVKPEDVGVFRKKPGGLCRLRFRADRGREAEWQACRRSAESWRSVTPASSIPAASCAGPDRGSSASPPTGWHGN
jgi:hypothetical protein